MQTNIKNNLFQNKDKKKDLSKEKEKNMATKKKLEMNSNGVFFLDLDLCQKVNKDDCYDAYTIVRGICATIVK